MPEMKTADLQLWTARPAEFGADLSQAFHGLLDESERERAARFQHEADRRSYVLAHALRRCVLAQWLGATPRELVFSHEPEGRPVLVSAHKDVPYFSHSRSRDAVAFAVTRLAPVGVDVEPVRPGGADDELLARFLVPDDRVPTSELARLGRDARFYFYWTALEAFWKAQGKGLADGNPRIQLGENTPGQLEVWLEGDASGPHAQLFPARDCDRACTTVALFSMADVQPQLCNGNMRLFSAHSAHGMLSAR